VTRIPPGARRRRARRLISAKPMCFDLLAGHRRSYELVVLDPPAFAKSRRHVDAASNRL